MGTTKRQCFTRLICCILAINLLATPLVHASWLVMDESMSQHAAAGCHSPGVETETITMPAMPEPNTMSPNLGCEHGSFCKLMCSTSSSMLHQQSALPAFEQFTRWLPVEPTALISAFPSRLEKPPRP